MRTINIPESNKEPRRHPKGDEQPCIVCSEPINNPRYMIHVINGGGVALHAEDEQEYQPDGGDLGFYPIGPDCLRRHPHLKPFVWDEGAKGPGIGF